jgi:hypothetical protein
LGNWSAMRVFMDGPGCVGDLKGAIGGSLHDPEVGEAGRRFLAARLALLSDRQIRDLFTAARIEGREETLEEGGRRRPVTVDDWVRVFKEKRREIAERVCPK